MIHDFATAPRQTDWRQPKPAEKQRSKNIKSAQTRAEVPPKLKIRRAMVSVFAVSLLVFIGQSVIFGSEPELDQQPDAAAKREYAKSMLLSGEADVMEKDTVAEDSVGKVSASLGVQEVSSELQQSVQADSTAESSTDNAADRVQVSQTIAIADNKNKNKSKTGSAEAEASQVAIADIRVDPDYGFYDSLKQGSWPVPVNKGVYVDGELAERERPVYNLQAASFRNKADAYRLAGKLKKQRLAAVVVPSVSSNGQYWYQVSVGPFISTTKLNKAQDILVSMSMMPLKKRVQ